jgi:transposase
MRQEVLTGPERRRRWSVDEKLRILAEAEMEGSRVADIARRHDITRQHIYQWRRELRGKGLLSLAPPVFLPVELASEIACRNRADGDARREHRVEIGLRNGRTVRISADVPDDVLHRVIRIAEAS